MVNGTAKGAAGCAAKSTDDGATSDAGGPRLRPGLDLIPGYRAGRRPEPRTDLITYKVSSNENPYPPLPRVREAIAAAAAEVNRYPDPGSTQLVAAIAAHHDVPETDVVVATGAVALCYQAAHAAAGPGDEVIYPWRSFEAYPIVAHVCGAKPVPVALTATEEHDLEAMATMITPVTRVIFVCTPNNPTGTVVTEAQLTAFLAAVPADVLVVVDEAYIEFADRTDVADGVAACRRHPNVMVLRTFSKAYGLAGLRVGYALAQAPLAQALRKTALPFGVSSLAEAAAIASLADHTELMQRVADLAGERERMIAELRARGLAITESQANFIWLRLGGRTAEFSRCCDEAGLTIRAFPGEGVRVTIGEPAANDRFIELAATLI